MWLTRRDEYRAFYEAKEHDNERYFSGRMSRERVASIRHEKFRNAVRYLRTKSPFYKELLSRFREDHPFSELPRLPLTTKEDLRANRHAIQCIPTPECDLYCETTGTTGEAAASPRHAFDRISSVSNFIHSWRPMVPEGTVVGIIGPTELHGMVDTFTDVVQGLNCCVAKIYPFSTKVNFTKALAVMKNLRVETLCVTPTISLMLAKAAMDGGFNLDTDFALKRIFLTGELCSNEMCRNVSSFWGAPAINNPFASQECLGMAAGAMTGKLHTYPLSYVYELIDPTTHESTYHSVEGTVDRVVRGELVITMLEPGARPLLRYRTGDYAELAPCRFANLEGSVAITPLGRVKDIIALPGGRKRTAHEIEEAILRPLRRVLSYELTLLPPSHDPVLKVEVLLEPKRTLTGAEAGSVAESIRECCGVQAEVVQVERAGGASNMSALAGWKAARFKDLASGVRDAEREYAEMVGSRRVGTSP